MNKEYFLPMSMEEYEGENLLQTVAAEKLRQKEFSDGAVNNIEIGISKLAQGGGEPFYRLAFRAAGSMNQPTESVKILFLLMENYGVHGGASMSKAHPVELIHDFRGDFFEKSEQLAGFLDNIVPEDAKTPHSPKPPAP